MKTKKFWLPCIAAVAIATFVGAKSFKTNASESNELLLANVEALSQNDGDVRRGYSMATVWYKANVNVSSGIEISLTEPSAFWSWVYGETWSSLRCCMSSVDANLCDFKLEDSKCKNTVNRRG